MRTKQLNALDIVGAASSNASSIALSAVGFNQVKSVSDFANYIKDQSHFSALNGLSAALGVISLKELYNTYKNIQAHGASIGDSTWRGEERAEDNPLTFKDFMRGAADKPLHIIGMVACVGLIIGAIVALSFGMPLVTLGLAIAAVTIAKVNSYYLDTPVNEFQALKTHVEGNAQNLLGVTEAIKTQQASGKLQLDKDQQNLIKECSDKLSKIGQIQDAINDHRYQGGIKKEFDALVKINKVCKQISDSISEEILNGRHVNKSAVEELVTRTKKVAETTERSDKNIQKLQGGAKSI